MSLKPSGLSVRCCICSGQPETQPMALQLSQHRKKEENLCDSAVFFGHDCLSWSVRMCEMERSFHQTVSMTDWAKLRQEKALDVQARRETGVCPPSGWVCSRLLDRID